ncbi:MAG TPA: divalent-cation tolerance protein CutA [Candidatus Omnitrophota bacterium]|nr:divalent-cation tolerance protein CutA [Candidatus Omnitrophota bacterium]HPS37000.1 divalent-cation tolerance protein CutA [Candidatus Omnitrophota bacterium]
MKYLCVLSTVPNIKKAREIAGLLVSRGLAACVQVLPGLESHYRWKGKKETSPEVLLIIKTKASAYKKLEMSLLKNHPYEVSELVALPITRGSKAYLDWIDEEVTF